MKVNYESLESSIAPFGAYRGFPATIVKLTGCNLRCKGCVQQLGKKIGVSKLISEVNKSNNNVVIFTGGEPLLQEAIFQAIYELNGRGYKILVETNGSLFLEDEVGSRGFHYRVNLRVPNTKQEDKNKLDMLVNLKSGDEVCFKVNDIFDYEFAKDIIKKYNTNATYVLTPIPELGDLIADWVIEDRLYNVKLEI